MPLTSWAQNCNSEGVSNFEVGDMHMYCLKCAQSANIIYISQSYPLLLCYKHYRLA